MASSGNSSDTGPGAPTTGNNRVAITGASSLMMIGEFGANAGQGSGVSSKPGTGGTTANTDKNIETVFLGETSGSLANDNGDI